MKDLLEFIDSSDIREYNRETKFAPAEWAVLIIRLLTRRCQSGK